MYPALGCSRSATLITCEACRLPAISCGQCAKKNMHNPINSCLNCYINFFGTKNVNIATKTGYKFTYLVYFWLVCLARPHRPLSKRPDSTKPLRPRHWILIVFRYGEKSRSWVWNKDDFFRKRYSWVRHIFYVYHLQKIRVYCHYKTRYQLFF